MIGLDKQALEVLVARKGLRKAARELGMSPATLRKRIAGQRERRVALAVSRNDPPPQEPDRLRELVIRMVQDQPWLAEHPAEVCRRAGLDPIAYYAQVWQWVRDAGLKPDAILRARREVQLDWHINAAVGMKALIDYLLLAAYRLAQDKEPAVAVAQISHAIERLATMLGAGAPPQALPLIFNQVQAAAAGASVPQAAPGQNPLKLLMGGKGGVARG